MNILPTICRGNLKEGKSKRRQDRRLLQLARPEKSITWLLKVQKQNLSPVTYDWESCPYPSPELSSVFLWTVRRGKAELNSCRAKVISEHAMQYREEVWEKARTHSYDYKRMMGAWGKGTRFYMCRAANLIDLPELLISPAVKLCKCNTSENETLHLSWTPEIPDCGMGALKPLQQAVHTQQENGKLQPAFTLRADFMSVLGRAELNGM